MSKGLEYLEKVKELIEKVKTTQGEKIEEAGRVMAEAIAKGGIIYFCGSGHARMIALEGVGRAGGLIPADAIPEGPEQEEGVGREIMKKYNFPPHSVIVIISNSGRNPFTIDVALQAKEMGLKVIAITNLNHSRSVTSRHSSGKRLFEVADIVIDNCGELGDAIMKVEGTDVPAGATSGVIGAAIVQAMVVEAADRLGQMGIEPPLYLSANIDGGPEHNKKMDELYREKLQRARGEHKE